MSKDILILTPFYPPNKGGAETFAQELVKEVSKWFHVTVVTFMPFRGSAKKLETKITKNGSTEIIRMNWFLKPPQVWKGVSLRNMLLVFPKMLLFSFTLCLKKKFKIVHSQGLLSAMVGCILKAFFNCKHYTTLLALYDFESRPKWFCYIVRFIFDNCDGIFVEGYNGELDAFGVYRKFIKRMGDAEKYRPKFIQFTHWCDQDKFKPIKKEKHKKMRVLYVGRPMREKGIDIVRNAEDVLNKNNFEFRYVTEIEYSKLPKIYQWADVLVVPSLYSEGYSRVVIEGASCGCAVITSNCGSLPEQVTEFGKSISMDSGRLGRILALYNAAPDIYIQKMRKKSIEYSKKNFSSKNSEVFLNAYSK